MKKYTLLLLLGLVGACSIPKPMFFNPPCEKENLITQFKNRYPRMDWSKKDIMIKENDSVFILMYVPKSQTARDGNAHLEVSKKDCKIILERYF